MAAKLKTLVATPFADELLSALLPQGVFAKHD
jgi:hypothetical protein